MKQIQTTRIAILTGLLYLCLLGLAAAGDVQVSARIEQQGIYIGQPFALTIVIEGADDVSQPDLTGLRDFQSQFLGQSQNSSIQIFNGHRESSTTYELNYQFTAQREVTAIPSITVMVDGKPYTTRAIAVTTKQPEENEDFKLEVRLSKPTAYVGQPLLMTTTWLIGKKARGGGFNLPILTDPNFTTSIRQDLLPGNKNQLIKIELGGEVILAKQYRKTVAGQEFLAITFFHTLIPKTPGNLSLPRGTITVNALAGYETPGSRRNRDPFAILGNRQREIYKTYVIPATPVTLKVLPLPKQDVPPHFNGLVGKYTIAASINPTTVNVGDPISLRLKITGDAADTITMPRLSLDQFKISNDPPKQTASFDAATFTTTIRARDEKVTQVPAIPLSFFNVETGQYKTIRTEPIQITVRPTRIITAGDALGGNDQTTPVKPEPRAEVHQGIYYNYADIQADESPATGKILLWLALLVPPALFALIVLITRDVDRSDKAKRRRKQRAGKQLRRDIAQKKPLFDAWLVFLGNELNRQPQTITVQDILPHLGNHPDLAQQVQHIFQTGEAMIYGGSNKPLEPQLITRTADQLHKVLK